MTDRRDRKLPNLDNPVEWLTPPDEVVPARLHTLRELAATYQPHQNKAPQRPCSDCPLRKHEEAHHG